MNEQHAPYIPSGGYTSDIVALIDSAHAANITPILWGESGVGKTALIEALSQRPGHDGMTKVMLNTMDRTDALGLPRGETVEGKTATVYADPFWVVQANASTGTHYVFFDEFSLADPEMQGSCLTILHSRTMPSGTKVADHVKFVAAANPADIITNGYELSPPLANRLMHLDYAPPVNEWYEGMSCAWGEDVSNEEIEFRISVTAFLKTKPELVHQTDNHLTWKAWPSRRSWDNAARTAYALDEGLRLRAMSGFVGEGPAEAFAVFAKGFVLPKPEEVAADPTLIDWHDATMGYAALSAVTQWCDDVSKFDGAARAFNYAIKNGPKDVPVVLAARLIDRVSKISKGKFPPLDMAPDAFGKFAKEMFPTHGSI
jgi:hypothetical protein